MVDVLKKEMNKSSKEIQESKQNKIGENEQNF